MSIQNHENFQFRLHAQSSKTLMVPAGPHYLPDMRSPIGTTKNLKRYNIRGKHHPPEGDHHSPMACGGFYKSMIDRKELC